MRKRKNRQLTAVFLGTVMLTSSALSSAGIAMAADETLPAASETAQTADESEPSEEETQQTAQEKEDSAEQIESSAAETTESAQQVETPVEDTSNALRSSDHDLSAFAEGNYRDFTENTQVLSWNLGTDLTKEDVYSAEKGYGFSDVEFNTDAPGWVNGVYMPREASKQAPGSTYVENGEGYLAFSSKVWTETESTGYGVYTYENTSTLDLDLASADYKVDVTFVNPTQNAYTAYIETEDITKEVTFTGDDKTSIVVNPGETVTKSVQAVVVDGQLNLKFPVKSSATSIGGAGQQTAYISHLTVTRLATNQTAEKPTIFIASDSTVQTYDQVYYPQTGWGQTLHNFFGDLVEERECEDCLYSQAQTYETVNVIVENRAIGGRSSKSFIDEGKLDDLLEDVKPGDYVFVQWGHNDATASRPNRYVSSEDFEKWINVYIDGALQRGATPVLVTPVARYSYSTNADGTLDSFQSNFEAYRQVMLKVSQERQVALIDLTQRSIALCNSFGIEGSKSLFLFVEPGEYEGNYAGGANDSTHLQYYGAYKFAQCVAQGVQENSALADLASKIVMKIPENVPGQIKNFTINSVGSSSVSMSWDADADAELYYIYRQELTEGMTADDVDFSNADKYSVSSTTKYTDNGCEGGKTYVYAVRGFNEKGLGTFSDYQEVTTKSAGWRFDINYGSSPTMDGWIGINESLMYSEELGYGWIKSPGNGRYRGNNGNADSSDMADDFCLGEGELAVDLPNGDYEVTVYAADLLPGTSTIKPAYTAEGSSLGSISTKQSLGECTGTVRVIDGQLNLVVGGTNPYINGFTITELLKAPSGLNYSELSVDEQNGTASFLLGFNTVEEAVSYNVYCKNSTDTEFSIVKSFTAQELIDSDLDCRSMSGEIGETYEYYMTCVTADGTESAQSNTITVETVVEGPQAAAPQNVICISPTEDSTELQRYITLSWDEVEGAVKYIIYRSDKAEGDKGFKEFTKVGESRTTEFTDEDDVATNIHYYYKVAAVTKTGLGELSEVCQTPVSGSFVPGGRETYADRAAVAMDLAGDPGAEERVTATDSEGNEYTSGVYLSWRSYEKDFDADHNLTTTFTVQRNGETIAEGLSVTNLVDEGGKGGDQYTITASTGDVTTTTAWNQQYLELNLFAPADETMPDGSTCTFSANDMSVGDLDGDGVLELIVKWYPSNAQDNSGYAYTGKTFLDGYDIDYSTGAAKLLWRIDMGVNIRSGAHYTQFQVWDYDGDGKAEIAVKTADGTTTYQSSDGTAAGLMETGYVGACNSDALPTNVISAENDYRNTSGFILDGPEYFTMFDGDTGKIIDTVDYVPTRGNVGSWGDTYGNRVDRFLSATAYLDGETPFAVFARGYYTRTCLTAYYLKDTDADGIGDAIAQYWTFDSNEAGTQYEAQGNHGLSVNDIDGDGRDEIIYGALVIDHDGTVKYSTGLGHGDAMHVSDWVSWNDGLEIMSVHEHADAQYQVEVRDAETGTILMGYYTGKDTGRGVAADIDPTSEGAEWWSIASPTYEGNDEPSWDSTDGEVYSSWSTLENLIKLSNSTPASNAAIYWDGDLLAEIQDHKFDEPSYSPIGALLSKWNYETEEQETLLYSTEIYSNNGTKGNMGLLADILGDWREEIITRCSANANNIRIYSTNIQTDYVVPCFLEDQTYREAVAWQNVGYNQPPHTEYLLSQGLVTAQLSAGTIGSSEAEIQFTPANDGDLYGHEITGYQIYRAEGDGEYTLIDEVSVDELETGAIGGSGETAEDEILYSNDFENGTDFTAITEGQQEVVADPATENAHDSMIYRVFAASGGSRAALSPQIGTSEDGVKVSADLRLDPGQTNQSTVFALLGEEENQNWLDAGTLQILTIDALTGGTNGFYDSITINGVDITEKANLTGTQQSGSSLKRDTTGWLHLEAVLNFTEQTVDVMLTRMATGEEIYSGTLPFVNTCASLEYMYACAGRNYGVVSLDNVSVAIPAEETPGTGEPTDVYVYTDTTVDQNTTYSYKIAAGVDGKTSHMSRALSVTTAIAVESVPEITLSDLVEGTPIPEGGSVADLLPKTVAVIDSEGNDQQASVTWDVSEVDINAVGEYTVYATVQGYDNNPIAVPLKVVANEIKTIQEPEDITIIVGQDVTLPETVTVEYTNTTTEEKAVTWNTDELDTNQTGDYDLTGTVEGTDRTVTITVKVRDNYVVSADDIYLEIDVNTANPENMLPSAISAEYADGTTGEANVIWNAAEIDTSVAGNTVDVTGTVGEEVTVTAHITVVYPAVERFDFGIDANNVAEGWTGVTVNGKGGKTTVKDLGIEYTAEKGYGFTNPDAVIEGRGEGYEQDGVLPSAVYTDFVLPAGQTFVVDVENGTYQVDLVSGSSYKSTVKATVEGSGISVGNSANSYTIGSVTVEVADGQLTIAFDSTNVSRLDAIIVRQVAAGEDPSEPTDPTDPEETTPEETTPEESTPEETTPEESTPEETTPEESTPEETTPEESTPEETTPEESTPEETTPEETTPEESTPEETTPEESTPEETTPEESTPEETTPEESTPEETTPEESTPEETTPEESTPEETTPEESTPEGTTPEETPAETNPDDDSADTSDGMPPVTIFLGAMCVALLAGGSIVVCRRKENTED